MSEDKKIPKLHSGHMEVAVAKLFGYRQNVIVPNVSWGLGLNHECDLLVLSPAGYLTEIEIKISKGDLLADFKKPHGHESKIISRLVYAVPEGLLSIASEVVAPEHGLISVRWSTIGWVAEWNRKPKSRRGVLPISSSMKEKLLALGCMRIWSLKSVIHNLTQK